MADKALCSIPDCGKPYCARGYCSTHYKSIIQKGYKRPPTDPCIIGGCDRLSHGHGYCVKHYKRYLKYGDPLAGSTDWGAAKRFLENAYTHDDKDQCLRWPFSVNPLGLAQIRINKKTRNVPRLICERVHGPAPSSAHQAAHSCGKGHESCVNPHHLSWKTQRENEADKVLHGTHNAGTRHHLAKLTAQQVRMLRANEPYRTETYKQIAERFGMEGSSIRAVIKGITYKDV